VPDERLDSFFPVNEGTIVCPLLPNRGENQKKAAFALFYGPIRQFG
jgi:hypothetical protein